MTIDTPQIPAAEAASALGTTLPRILMLLKQGALEGELAEGEWYVSRQSLDRALKEGIDTPSPSRCATACSAGPCGCSGR